MKLVEFPLEDDTRVIVEVHEPDGPVRAGAKEKIEQAKETLEEALHKVLPATKRVMEKIRQTGGNADEIEISFGINLSTVAGAFIASASAEANFSVTMHWTGVSEKTTSAQAQPE
jgi:Trypsin-co-occurring domain 1